MATANLSLNVTAFLMNGKKDYVPAGINLTTTPAQFTLSNLAVGDNTVSPPAGTTHIVVVMPATTSTVTIRAIGASVGIPLSLSTTDTRWFVLPIGTSFIANSSVVVNGIEVLYL